jgi:outer membrane protein TolC
MTTLHPWRTAALLGLLAASPVAAQQHPVPQVRVLSLDSAVALAEPASEVVGIAKAGVSRAQGARSQSQAVFWPQITGNASYTRTLQSQFEGAFGSDTSVAGPDFSALPFGQANAWVVGVQGS